MFTAEERDLVRNRLLARAEADAAITGAALTTRLRPMLTELAGSDHGPAGRTCDAAAAERQLDT
jgi:hypothetical protein